MITEITSLPTPLLFALGILLAIQLALIAVSLILLARTPREQILLGKKWLWVLIIVCVNFIGAILFFALGRRPVVAAPTAVSAPTRVAVREIVDKLYGDIRT